MGVVGVFELLWLSFGVVWCCFDTDILETFENKIVIFGLLVFNLRKYLTVRWFLNFCV